MAQRERVSLTPRRSEVRNLLGTRCPFLWGLVASVCQVDSYVFVGAPVLHYAARGITIGYSLWERMFAVKNNMVQMRTSTLVFVLLLMGITGITGAKIGDFVRDNVIASASPAGAGASKQPIHMDYTVVPRRSFEDAVKYDVGAAVTPTVAAEWRGMWGTTPGMIRPGTAVYSGRAEGGCTMSRPTAVGDKWYVLTAGHCVRNNEVGLVRNYVAPFTYELGDSGTTYTKGGLDVGYYEVPESLYPDLDPFAVGRDHDNESSGWIHMNREVAVEPEVGDTVCMAGTTSGWVCGSVTEVDDELFGANLCARGGDSGAPLYTLDGGFVGILNSSIVDSEGNIRCLNNGYSNVGSMDTQTYATKSTAAMRWLEGMVGAPVNDKAMHAHSYEGPR